MENAEKTRRSGMIRTDLAMEQLEGFDGIPEGVGRRQYEKEGVTVTEVSVTEQGAATLGKPAGKYVTLELTPFRSPGMNFEGELSVVAEELRRFLPDEGLVLVAGLGNEEITPDAIGPRTAAGILATRHLEDAASIGLPGLRPVAAVAPGVLGQTGIETAEFIRSLCDRIRPAAVIAVDALAAGAVSRLGNTVQLADSGIAPGSGVQNKRKTLNRETLGIPVVALGVPTVADAAVFADGEAPGSAALSGCMVTPREIDVIVDKAASMLALAINRALQPTLSVEELLGLTD